MPPVYGVVAEIPLKTNKIAPAPEAVCAAARVSKALFERPSLPAPGLFASTRLSMYQMTGPTVMLIVPTTVPGVGVLPSVTVKVKVSVPEKPAGGT